MSGDVVVPDPVAFFIAWPTYGTWLPGDARGWNEYHHGWRLPQAQLKVHRRSNHAHIVIGAANTFPKRFDPTSRPGVLAACERSPGRSRETGGPNEAASAASGTTNHAPASWTTSPSPRFAKAETPRNISTQSVSEGFRLCLMPHAPKILDTDPSGQPTW